VAVGGLWNERGGIGMRTGWEDVSKCLFSLSGCRGLVSRTSHELEGHGHALLVVRHICGISRGVRLGGVGEWAGLAVLCCAVICDRDE
jgi:hypothetical protein